MGQFNLLFAKIAVSGTNYSFDSLYTYRVPTILHDTIMPGQRVLVPFGRGNRKSVGVVMKVYERDDEFGIKSILHLIDREPIINDELLNLIVWMKENTFCTYYEAFKAMVPLGYSVSLLEKYVLSPNRPDADDPLSDDEKELYEFLLKCAEKPKAFDTVIANAPSELIEALVQKGLLEKESELKRRVGDETVMMVKLSEDYYDNYVQRSTTCKQYAVEQFLDENGPASVKEVIYNTGVTRTIIRNMIDKGVLTEYKYESLRRPEIRANGVKASEIFLTDEQQRAFSGIMELINKHQPAGAVLHGVTGSGKTEVFIKLIEKVIASGKSTLMLVPEISLTPQLVGKFKAAFGETVAVLHSALSLGQRMDEFKRAKRGDAKIVIGTRSAVFAPLSDIGLIIMDEEGESTYKSEQAPRYHARDVAIQRCGTHNCVLLMASATPSLETYYYAKSGRFHLFELKKRYNDTPLPEVIIADMALEAENGNQTSFCADLVLSINKAVVNHRQSILLINRRGYNTFVVCHDCREAIKCPNCLLPLVLHKQNSRLMCHCCGYSIKFNGTCPVCGGENVKASGQGTQYVEHHLYMMFDYLRILRMDSDTTSSRMQYEQKFKDFEDYKYDILVGTQMIAKGLDFPLVTLVGIVSIDPMLFSGSYKSYERTFSLITQVVGRGGRRGEKGLAYIQTCLPDHYVIKLAAAQDYEGFYAQEIALRRELIYPPFCDLMVITFASVSEDDCVRAANEFVLLMKRGLKKYEGQFPMRVLGPARSGQGRANGRYRYGITIKCKNIRPFREFISAVLCDTAQSKCFNNVKIIPDMNPETIN